MELVIFMIMMVFGYMFFGAVNAVENRNKPKPIPKCHEIDEIHDWSRHPVTDKLTCCKCNYEAGTE